MDIDFSPVSKEFGKLAIDVPKSIPLFNLEKIYIFPSDILQTKGLKNIHKQLCGPFFFWKCRHGPHCKEIHLNKEKMLFLRGIFIKYIFFPLEHPTNNKINDDETDLLREAIDAHYENYNKTYNENYDED